MLYINPLLPYQVVSIQRSNMPLFLRIVPVPLNVKTFYGQDGSMSYDSEYFYIYVQGWKRVAITTFAPGCSDNVPMTGTEGSVSYDSGYFYIYSKKVWRRVALTEVNLTNPGHQGAIMFDVQYFYIYTSGSWRRVEISPFV